jgi:ribosome-associated heat shock protein Hsp15
VSRSSVVIAVDRGTIVGVSEAPVRIDKWLWAARFFKTRALASDAVKGGKVDANGDTAKPSKAVKPGDRLQITVGQNRIELIVQATAEKRGPASVAQGLYEETEQSIARREKLAMQRKAQPMFDPGMRPTKRDRRELERQRAEERRRGLR